jgi:hypothetical protein
MPFLLILFIFRITFFGGASFLIGTCFLPSDSCIIFFKSSAFAFLTQGLKEAPMVVAPFEIAGLLEGSDSGSGSGSGSSLGSGSGSGVGSSTISGSKVGSGSGSGSVAGGGATNVIIFYSETLIMKVML